MISKLFHVDRSRSCDKRKTRRKLLQLDGGDSNVAQVWMGYDDAVCKRTTL